MHYKSGFSMVLLPALAMFVGGGKVLLPVAGRIHQLAQHADTC